MQDLHEDMARIRKGFGHHEFIQADLHRFRLGVGKQMFHGYKEMGKASHDVRSSPTGNCVAIRRWRRRGVMS
jgi:hypothetical protein